MRLTAFGNVYNKDLVEKFYKSTIRVEAAGEN